MKKPKGAKIGKLISDHFLSFMYCYWLYNTLLSQCDNSQMIQSLVHIRVSLKSIRPQAVKCYKSSRGWMGGGARVMWRNHLCLAGGCLPARLFSVAVDLFYSPDGCDCFRRERYELPDKDYNEICLYAPSFFITCSSTYILFMHYLVNIICQI